MTKINKVHISIFIAILCFILASCNIISETKQNVSTDDSINKKETISTDVPETISTDMPETIIGIDNVAETINTEDFILLNQYTYRNNYHINQVGDVSASNSEKAVCIKEYGNLYEYYRTGEINIIDIDYSNGFLYPIQIAITENGTIVIRGITDSESEYTQYNLYVLQDNTWEKLEKNISSILMIIDEKIIFYKENVLYSINLSDMQSQELRNIEEQGIYLKELNNEMGTFYYKKKGILYIGSIYNEDDIAYQNSRVTIDKNHIYYSDDTAIMISDMEEKTILKLRKDRDEEVIAINVFDNMVTVITYFEGRYAFDNIDLDNKNITRNAITSIDYIFPIFYEDNVFFLINKDYFKYDLCCYNSTDNLWYLLKQYDYIDTEFGTINTFELCGKTLFAYEYSEGDIGSYMYGFDFNVYD